MKETHHIVPVFYKNTISRGERKVKKTRKIRWRRNGAKS